MLLSVDKKNPTCTAEDPLLHAVGSVDKMQLFCSLLQTLQLLPDAQCFNRLICALILYVPNSFPAARHSNRVGLVKILKRVRIPVKKLRIIPLTSMEEAK